MSRSPSNILPRLTSKKAKCRLLGCSTCVPNYGQMVGITQAHCPHCGAKTIMASNTAPGKDDYDAPTYPEFDAPFLMAEIIVKLLRLLASPFIYIKMILS